MFLVFKNGVKSIQTASYNGTHTVDKLVLFFHAIITHQWQSHQVWGFFTFLANLAYCAAATSTACSGNGGVGLLGPIPAQILTDRLNLLWLADYAHCIICAPSSPFGFSDLLTALWRRLLYYPTASWQLCCCFYYIHWTALRMYWGTM